MSLNSAAHRLLDVLHGDHNQHDYDEAINALAAETNYKEPVTTANPTPEGATLPVHHEDQVAAVAVARGPEDVTEAKRAPEDTAKPKATRKKRVAAKPKPEAKAKPKPAAKTEPAAKPAPKATPVQTGQVASGSLTWKPEDK